MSTLVHIESLLMEIFDLVILNLRKKNSILVLVSEISLQNSILSIYALNFLHRNLRLSVAKLMISVSQVNMYCIELRHDGHDD